MNIVAKIPITGRLEKIKRNSFWKQHFLYPILFDEDLYGIVYNNSMDEGKFRKNRVYAFNNNLDFLMPKRLIKKLRQSDYSWVVPKFSNKFRIIEEIVIIIFNSIFTLGSKSIVKETDEWNSNRSIHSIFPFMENEVNESTIGLDITIPYSFHPEVLIRLFRQHISDTSFLHFLRLLLHQNENIVISTPELYPRKNQFNNLLWNIQIYKFEYSLIQIWKQIYNFQSNLFWSLIDQTNLIQKLGYISEKADIGPIDKIIRENYSIHYVRYRNSLIISTNVNFYLFSKNWNLFLLIIWEKYFHLWFEPYRVNIKDLSKNSICFLGYLFSIRGKGTLIQIQLVNNLIDANLVTKEFCSILPIVPLIRLLAREKFCDTSGRPICKVSWTTFTDFEIFGRFDQIIKNIFSHYSGCMKKKGLYQLQYILRFSCAKTLACKHKSTIRTVWKKYGSNFITKSVSVKKPRSISWRVYERKIWYLNIIQINYLAHLLQKFKNVRDC